MRIKYIASLLKGANTVLDIGTDHSKVLIEALNQDFIKKGIGSDINKGPLKNAYKNVKKANLEDKIKLVQSDGFKNIKDDYDVVVITGIGFELIKNILNEPHQQPNYYLIGSHHQVHYLRKYLIDNNYKIIDEYILFDKKYYIFLKVIKEKQILTNKEIYLGPILQTKKEAIHYYKELLNKHLKIKENHRSDEINQQISFLKEIIDSN